MLKYNLFPICNRKNSLKSYIVLGKETSLHVCNFHRFLIDNKFISGFKKSSIHDFVISEDYVDGVSSRLIDHLYELLKYSIKQDI
jgi:hypothetical protein